MKDFENVISCLTPNCAFGATLESISSLHLDEFAFGMDFAVSPGGVCRREAGGANGCDHPAAEARTCSHEAKSQPRSKRLRSARFVLGHSASVTCLAFSEPQALGASGQLLRSLGLAFSEGAAEAWQCRSGDPMILCVL